MAAIEGRQFLPTCLLSAPVVAELERRARAAGVDPTDRRNFAVFLGDLVAAELPGALAETAAALLAAGAEAERKALEKEDPVGLISEGAPSRSSKSGSSMIPAGQHSVGA